MMTHITLQLLYSSPLKTDLSKDLNRLLCNANTPQNIIDYYTYG